MKKLKPCPFCGDTVSQEILNAQDACQDDFGFSVCCSTDKDGCGGSGGYRGNINAAIKAWNKRDKNLKVPI